MIDDDSESGGNQVTQLVARNSIHNVDIQWSGDNSGQSYRAIGVFARAHGAPSGISIPICVFQSL